MGEGLDSCIDLFWGVCSRLEDRLGVFLWDRERVFGDFLMMLLVFW